MNDRPTGQRFSLTYVNRGDPTTDSKEMRFRLGKLIEKPKHQDSTYSASSRDYVYSSRRLQEDIEAELGVQFVTFVNGQTYYSWVSFFRRLPETKLVDAITVLYRSMAKRGRSGGFTAEVNRIFQEENIAYEVDAEGGVHPRIDGAFHALKQSSVRGMSDARYAVALDRIEEIDGHLMGSEPNYIQAIRAIFGANENLFKMMFNAPRLDQRSAKDKIGAILQRIHADHPVMQRSSAQTLLSFSAWIDSAHHYRHEQGSPEPNQPNEELAIVMISQGIAFARWLCAIDKKM